MSPFLVSLELRGAVKKAGKKKKLLCVEKAGMEERGE
jgi:hypothetical protein